MITNPGAGNGAGAHNRKAEAMQELRKTGDYTIYLNEHFKFVVLVEGDEDSSYNSFDTFEKADDWIDKQEKAAQKATASRLDLGNNKFITGDLQEFSVTGINRGNGNITTKPNVKFPRLSRGRFYPDTSAVRAAIRDHNEAEAKFREAESLLQPVGIDPSVGYGRVAHAQQYDEWCKKLEARVGSAQEAAQALQSDGERK